jgi:hypothetical protein
MALTVQQAKKFFGSLYEKDRAFAPDLGRFEAAALRLVASVADDDNAVPTKGTAAGDKALAVLLLNHVMSVPDLASSQKTALTAAALLNIKSEVVGRFVELFPDMTLEELTKSAKEAGYNVEILSKDVAARVPRSVVGR